jgi:hypothetical protein
LRSRSAAYLRRRRFDDTRVAVTFGIAQTTLRRGNLAGTRRRPGGVDPSAASFATALRADPARR